MATVYSLVGKCKSSTPSFHGEYFRFIRETFGAIPLSVPSTGYPLLSVLHPIQGGNRLRNMGNLADCLLYPAGQPAASSQALDTTEEFGTVHFDSESRFTGSLGFGVTSFLDGFGVNLAAILAGKGEYSLSVEFPAVKKHMINMGRFWNRYPTEIIVQSTNPVIQATYDQFLYVLRLKLITERYIACRLKADMFFTRDIGLRTRPSLIGGAHVEWHSNTHMSMYADAQKPLVIGVGMTAVDISTKSPFRCSDTLGVDDHFHFCCGRYSEEFASEDPYFLNELEDSCNQ